MTRTVAIVANPRRSGGARRRLEAIIALSEGLGCRVEVLQPTLSPSLRGSLAALPPLIGHKAVPEVLAWNPEAVSNDLALLAPDVVVYQTTRALHPMVVETARDARGSGPNPAIQILDLVDRLSVSYRQRARAGATVAYPAFRVLAAVHGRVEENLLSAAGQSGREFHVVAAGYREAEELGVHWIPNVSATLERRPPPGSAPSSNGDDCVDARPRHDAVFFGTLDYRPNVEALRTLHAWITENNSPPPTVLVAGRKPSAEVRELCRVNEWTLVSDFTSVADLARRAVVAIAPLRSTSGIQNKVMEAAQAGLPQVVTPAAVAGYHPDLPLPTFDTGPNFLAELRRLVDDPALARTQVAAVRRHLAASTSLQAVAPLWARLLRLDDGDSQPSPAPAGARRIDGSQ